MKVLASDTKFAHLGKPGTSFTPGFERRLQKILKYVDLKDKVILDQGCGEGVWMERFTEFTDPKNVYGEDIDPESPKKFEIRNSKLETKFQIPNSNVHIVPAEELDFRDNFFDIVFSNEVLEHVNDDRKSVEEAIRVLKPGGHFIIFTPNRGWPFETHGMFFRGKYYWGNIPLLPWMPAFIRRKFSPHVRNYSNGDIRRLFKNLPVEIVHHTHVFSGFDKLEGRLGILGSGIKKFFHWAEKTPLHFFGISHFMIVKKSNKG